MAEMISKEQIKNIWGFAKDIGINKDELYCIISRVSKKESMKALTKLQANKVIRELITLKDKNKKSNKRKNTYKNNPKRTDVGGNTDTVFQRQKIYELTEKLGWNNNNNRINGFVKRMFGIDRLEWLDEKQCNKLIEILKKMIQRQSCDKI